MPRRLLTFLGPIGLMLALYGIATAVLYENGRWYNFFTIGGTFFLADLALMLRGDAILCLPWQQLLLRYCLYVVVGKFFEVVFCQILGLWYYPDFHITEILIGYPFAFFMIHESWQLIRPRFAVVSHAFIVTTLFHAFAHELPNTVAKEWVYTIPHITQNILGINIVVIAGWSLLVTTPLLVDRLVRVK